MDGSLAGALRIRFEFLIKCELQCKVTVTVPSRPVPWKWVVILESNYYDHRSAIALFPGEMIRVINYLIIHPHASHFTSPHYRPVPDIETRIDWKQWSRWLTAAAERGEEEDGPRSSRFIVIQDDLHGAMDGWMAPPKSVFCVIKPINWISAN